MGSFNALVCMLSELNSDWTGAEYKIVGRNCQTFAVALCERIGLPDSIPPEYVQFAKEWDFPIASMFVVDGLASRSLGSGSRSLGSIGSINSRSLGSDNR